MRRGGTRLAAVWTIALVAMTPGTSWGHAGHAHGRAPDPSPCVETTMIAGIGHGCRRGSLFRITGPDGRPAFVHGGDQDPDPTSPTEAVARFKLAAAPGGKGNGKGGNTGGTTGGATTPAPAPAPSSDPAWICAAEPEPAYQVIWAPGTATPADPELTKATIRDLVHRAMLQVQDRGLQLAPGTRYRLKVRCDADGQLSVPVEPVLGMGSAPSFFQIISPLVDRGYERRDTNYLVMTSFNASYAGIAYMGHPSNAGGLYAQISSSGWTPRTLMHEMMHNMGAVPDGSPNNSGFNHCNDGLDVMCYADGGPTSNFTTNACRVQVVDCGADDYFHPDPAPGTFLADHDNLAIGNDWFLVERDGDATAPTVTLDADTWARPGVWFTETDGSHTWRPPAGIVIEDDGAIRSTTWRIDGGEPIARFDTELPPELTNGAHHVEVTARDTAGLVTQASGPVKVDRAYAYVSDLQPAAGVPPRGVAYYVVGASDPRELGAYVHAWQEDSAVTGFQYCFVVWTSDASTNACTDPASTAEPLVDWTDANVTLVDRVSANVRVRLDDPLAEGTQVTVCARVEDAAGNQAPTRCAWQRALVDLTAPLPPLAASESANGVTDLDWWASHYRTIPVTYERASNTGGTMVRDEVCVTRLATCDEDPDPVVGWHERWDGRIPVAEPLPHREFLRVCARHVDLAGNTSAAVCGDGLRADAVAPSSTIEQVGEAVVGQPARFRVTIGDDGAGIERAWVIVEDGANGSCQIGNYVQPGTYEARAEWWCRLDAGTHRIDVTVGDLAYNRVTRTGTFEVRAAPPAGPSTSTSTSTGSTTGTTGSTGSTTTTTTGGGTTGGSTTTSGTTGTGSTGVGTTTTGTNATTSTGGATPIAIVTTTASTATTGTPPPTGTTGVTEPVRVGAARCRTTISARRIVRLRACPRAARVQQLVRGRWVAARGNRIANRAGRDRWRVVVGTRILARGTAR